MAGTPRKDIDNDALERDYRSGRFTTRELGKMYGLSHVAVQKRAKSRGWTQDLSEAVRIATRAAVINEQFKRDIGDADEEVAKAYRSTVRTIQAAAELNKEVILGHRKDIAGVRESAMAMLAELNLLATHPQEIERMFEILSAEMSEAQISAARLQFQNLLRLHSRISSVHKLADSLTKLQALERKAFGLDEKEDNPTDGDSVWVRVASDAD